MSVIKLALVPALAVAALVLPAGPAHAAAGGKLFGDCILNIRTEGYAGGVRASGNVDCGNRHASTSATVTLKRNTVPLYPPASTTFTNSYGLGGRWLSTPVAYGCAYYQGVMEVAISGLGSTYVTTGSPDVWC